MNHESVAATHAVERYLLSEMPPEEVDAFEQHFFECDECADEVRSGAAFMANARAVFTEDNERRTIPVVQPVVDRPKRWFGFLRPAWGMAAAGLVLALGLFQTVQRLPIGVAVHQVGPIALSPGEVRGETDRAVYNPGDTLILKLDIEEPDATGPHVFELRDRATNQELARVQADITGDDIRHGKEIRFRDRSIQTDRVYYIVLRSLGGAKAGQEVHRYPLTLASK